MKFSVSSSELLKNVQIASGAINPNAVLPILEDFLFELDGNKLSIAATNLETSIINGLEVSGEKNGKIAVPAKILLDTLKALPDQPITFLVNEENNGIELTSAFGKYKLAGDSPADFPSIPVEEDVQDIKVDPSAIQRAISNTLFAASTDELRLAMTGVYVQVDFNKLIFVATDAHKLVKYANSSITSDQTSSFIIPRKGLNLLKNALSNDGDLTMSFNKTNMFFNFGDSKVVCRLVDAKYPDYNAVIPVNNPNTLTLNRSDFQNSLKRIVIYANKTTNQVILNINEGTLTISAQDLDFSNEATEQLTCSYTGDPMTIGFNAKFLIEMLGVVKGDEIRMELSTPNRAGILYPSEQEENEDLLMLVMPVMMSN